MPQCSCQVYFGTWPSPYQVMIGCCKSFHRNIYTNITNAFPGVKQAKYRDFSIAINNRTTASSSKSQETAMS